MTTSFQKSRKRNHFTRHPQINSRSPRHSTNVVSPIIILIGGASAAWLVIASVLHRGFSSVAGSTSAVTTRLLPNGGTGGADSGGARRLDAPAAVASLNQNDSPPSRRSVDSSVVSKPSELQSPICPYHSLRDLHDLDRYPRASASRHVVDPPNPPRPTISMSRKMTQASANETTTTTALVCCRTTAGPISIAVRSSWAPYGARRFLDMVRSGYYSRLRLDDADGGRNETDFVGVGGKSEVDKQFLGVVPLMRCVEGFICQFGLRGGASELFSRKIPDDPNWLPQGRTPQARRNALGVKRFMKGYVAYAGSGPNSRGRQIFVSLADQSGLGSAPWEVPFAELVGPESYRTLDNMYTGYGEDGPSQESLLTDAGLEDARSQFPELDWIVSCDVVDEETY